jgi:nucleotide-binding universal stress UspA family protein
MQPTTFSSSQIGKFVTPDRIVAATDLSDGNFLIPHVVGQAKATGARVSLVHAILPSNSFPLESGYAPYPDEKILDRNARLELQGIAREIELQGVSCDAYLTHGFAADVIRGEIKRTGATRLIMGTHGRGKWGQLALGSVANELLGSLDIPVFVVGPHASPAIDQVTPRRILHPVSLIGDYKKSLEIAFHLAKNYGAELTLLHVLDIETEANVTDVTSRSLTWAENALRTLVPAGNDLKPPIKVRAVCGKLVEGMLKAATETKADWMVLGVDSRLPYLSFRNTAAYQVIAGAGCCVLAVHHDSRVLEVEDRDSVEGHLSCAIV